MKTALRIILLSFCFCVISFIEGCATVKPWTEDKKVDASNRKPEDGQTIDEQDDGGKGASNRVLELKLAKIWAKVDELEDELSNQKQKMAILEKGLLLGIVPEEIKSPAEKSTQIKPETEVTHAVILETPKELPTKTEAGPQHENAGIALKDRAALIQEAQQYFEQGQYGRALAIYSSFEGGEDQNHRYWIGLCWLKLKEFETAHKEFSEFIAKNPTSAWIPRANYYLAQIDYQLGYKERSIQLLRKIISEYPDEDAAQMARSSIENMEKNL